MMESLNHFLFSKISKNGRRLVISVKDSIVDSKELLCLQNKEAEDLVAAVSA